MKKTNPAKMIAGLALAFVLLAPGFEAMATGFSPAAMASSDAESGSAQSGFAGAQSGFAGAQNGSSQSGSASGSQSSSSPGSQSAQSIPLAADENSEVGFYVQARIPENQIDTRQTYFDLLVEPRARQTLEVDIVNQTGSTIQIGVAAVSASTNRNGVIDYRTPDVRDETLSIPFSDIAVPAEDTIVVPPLATVAARIALTIPEEAFQGDILGGLVFEKIPVGPDDAVRADTGSGSAAAASSSDGVAVRNLYSYVIGVRLREDETPVAPHFEVVEVAPALVNYRGTAVHVVRNCEASIVSGLDVRVDIFREGDDEVVAQEQRTVSMAPNSTMELAVVMPNSRLVPGTYNSITTLRLGDETWEYENSFTIDAAHADMVNSNVLAPKPAGAVPLWVWVLLGAMLLAILALVIMLYGRNESRPAKRQ